VRVVELPEPSLRAAWATVEVESVVVHRWDPAPTRRSAVLGGPFAGRIVAVGPVEPLDPSFAAPVPSPGGTELPAMGSRVVGVARAGSCAEYVSVPRSTLSVLHDDHVGCDAAAQSAISGLRASLAHEALAARGVRSVIVLGASGPTGCIVGGLAARAGWRAIAVTSRPGVIAGLESCGFANVLAAGSADDAATFQRYLEQLPAVAVVDCTDGEYLTRLGQASRGPASTVRATVVAFTGRRRSASAATPTTEVLIDVVRASLVDPVGIARQFREIAVLLGTGVLRLPTTVTGLDDLPAYCAGSRAHRLGALVVHPRRAA